MYLCFSKIDQHESCSRRNYELIDTKNVENGAPMRKLQLSIGYEKIA